MLVSSPSHVTFLSHTLGMLGRTRVIPFPQALPPRHKTPEPKVCEAQNHTSWYLKQSRLQGHSYLSVPFLEILPSVLQGGEGDLSSVFTWPLASHLFQQLCSPYTWYCAWSNHCWHLPVSVLDFMFSGPGRSVAVFPVSFYWAVQGRI